MSINQNLARVLQRYRQKHGLSIQELADRIGIPKSSVECYLNGTGNPRADTLELISRKTGIPLTEIVSDPLPEQKRTETIIQVAETLSVLPPKHQKEVIQHVWALTQLFADGSHN